MNYRAFNAIITKDWFTTHSERALKWVGMEWSFFSWLDPQDVYLQILILSNDVEKSALEFMMVITSSL